MCATVVYPHYVTNEELVVRFLHHHTLTIPLSAVAKIHSENKAASKNKTLALNNNSASLNVLGSTNISLSLAANSIVVHNEKPLDISPVRFSFYADNQSLAINSIREKLTHAS